jgi:hypothetical protein
LFSVDGSFAEALQKLCFDTHTRLKLDAGMAIIKGVVAYTAIDV